MWLHIQVSAIVPVVPAPNYIAKSPPGLTKAGKFPTLIEGGADLTEKIDGVRATIKFQMKKVMCLNVAVGNVSMEKAQIVTNVTLASNFLASLLKKNWQNIKVLYVKSTMGPPQQIFF